MDVDFLFVLMRYFWKKACNAIAIHNKRYLFRHSDKKLRTKTGFSRNTILCNIGSAHFFETKQHKNALWHFGSGKLRSPRASKHLL